jgi:hypothetical protein
MLVCDHILSSGLHSRCSILDDWFVIAVTDANFGRYQITPEELKRAMNRDPKVHAALVCIGEGADAPWYGHTYMFSRGLRTYRIRNSRITRDLPGRAFRVKNTADIPTVLRSILSTMIDP